MEIDYRVLLRDEYFERDYFEGGDICQVRGYFY